MNVLFDDCGLREPVGGVSRYFSELIRHLPSDVRWEIAASETTNAFLKREPFNLPQARHSIRDLLPGVHFRGKSIVHRALSLAGVYRGMELENDRLFSSALRRGDADIVHLTGPHGTGTVWRGRTGRAKTVMTVHDLIPDMWCTGVRGNRVRHQRKYDLAHCDAIIAVSESTKRDLLRLYDVAESKVSVIHHGWCARVPRGSGEAVHPGKYILFVGKRAWYKNFDFFVRELVPLMETDRELKLVCAGGAFNEGERLLLAQLGLADRAVTRLVSDAELADLYAHAQCFVYPSRYEGFGIPILEAFAAGCPIVLSNASCFPEIGGDAALYFELDDGESMRAAIRSAMGCRRTELVEKGRTRLREFSWEKCARKTLTVYNSVLGATCE